MPASFLPPITLTATVSATGAATVDLGPNGYDWVLTSSSVSCTSSAGVVDSVKSTVSVYRNTLTAFVEGTTSGNGDASNTRHVLSDGDRLYFVWAGATPGYVATVTVLGTRFPSGTAHAEVQW